MRCVCVGLCLNLPCTSCGEGVKLLWDYDLGVEQVSGFFEGSC